MKKIYLQSLGCSKNLVDSENMLGILKSKKYEITEFADKADYIIINTCSFINDAKEESINTIISATEVKKHSKKDIAIVVTGCLAQRYSEELSVEIPEIDIIVGTKGYDKIYELIEKYEKEKTKILYTYDLNDVEENLPRNTLTENWYAYLKIAEGCDNHCTYCIIPKIRGSYKSRKIENIIEEAKKLSENGVKELIIIAQDTSKYGVDFYGGQKLHELLHELSKLDNIEWIRVHYMYPEDIYDDLINEFKTNKKLLNYFDIPLQHINDRVLKRMNRKTNKQQIINLIEKLRKELDSPVIRTSLITGFPGETDEEHEELKSFLQEYKLDRVGIFKYSREEDTPAYKLEDQIDEEIKDNRHQELMELQMTISYEKNLERINNIYDVLIEEKDVENIYVGRTYMDSVEIDGVVYVNSEKELELGNIYKVKINDALEYDLMGDVL